MDDLFGTEFPETPSAADIGRGPFGDAEDLLSPFHATGDPPRMEDEFDVGEWFNQSGDVDEGASAGESSGDESAGEEQDEESADEEEPDGESLGSESEEEDRPKMFLDALIERIRSPESCILDNAGDKWSAPVEAAAIRAELSAAILKMNHDRALPLIAHMIASNKTKQVVAMMVCAWVTHIDPKGPDFCAALGRIATTGKTLVKATPEIASRVYHLAVGGCAPSLPLTDVVGEHLVSMIKSRPTADLSVIKDLPPGSAARACVFLSFALSEDKERGGKRHPPAKVAECLYLNKRTAHLVPFFTSMTPEAQLCAVALAGLLHEDAEEGEYQRYESDGTVDVDPIQQAPPEPLNLTAAAREFLVETYGKTKAVAVGASLSSLSRAVIAGRPEPKKATAPKKKRVVKKAVPPEGAVLVVKPSGAAQPVHAMVSERKGALALFVNEHPLAQLATRLSTGAKLVTADGLMTMLIRTDQTETRSEEVGGKKIAVPEMAATIGYLAKNGGAEVFVARALPVAKLAILGYVLGHPTTAPSLFFVPSGENRGQVLRLSWAGAHPGINDGSSALVMGKAKAVSTLITETILPEVAKDDGAMAAIERFLVEVEAEIPALSADLSKAKGVKMDQPKAADFINSKIRAIRMALRNRMFSDLS